MHSRLIFLHRLPILTHECVLSRQILRLDVEVSQDRGRFVAEVCGERSEKSAEMTTQLPVLKLTQVDEENILRRASELWLRN
jgi:hypothetical protein